MCSGVGQSGCASRLFDLLWQSYLNEPFNPDVGIALRCVKRRADYRQSALTCQAMGSAFAWLFGICRDKPLFHAGLKCGGDFFRGNFAQEQAL